MVLRRYFSLLTFILSFVVAAHVSAAVPIAFDGAPEYDHVSKTTAEITVQVNRSLESGEKYTVSVANAANKELKQGQFVAGSVMKLTVPLQKDATYRVALKDTSGRVLSTMAAAKKGLGFSAAGGGTGTCYRFYGTLFGDGICANDYITRLYAWAVGLAVTAAALMVIYAGYKYTVSRGDQGAIKDAKEIVINVLVGLLLLVLSYTILRFLGVNVVSP